MQPIELVEDILRQNLTLISRVPHKCTQVSDIENPFGLDWMLPEIYFEMPHGTAGAALSLAG